MKIGIDFGSTYSTVSRYDDKTGRAEALTLGEGSSASVPSVVVVTPRGEVRCGGTAKNQMGKRNLRVFEAFKMLLTEQDRQMLERRGYDEEFTPRAVTRSFLQFALRGICNRYETDQFEEVCICVPEIWWKTVRALDGRAILRDLLLREMDDMTVGHVRVVTEPEAASAFFAHNYEKDTGEAFNGHLLLIDYGGGTLDVTLTQVTSDGQGAMEIGYRESGGAGENHPDGRGGDAIGRAGIAYMQGIVTLAMREQGFLGEEENPDFTSPGFISAVQDLEVCLKDPDSIKHIEDTFGEFGSGYGELEEILEEKPMQFTFLDCDEGEILVTYQHLFRAYQKTIEGVLGRELAAINEKVGKHIGVDPCSPTAGQNDNFKIALVGGFGSFYLVKKQIAEIYHLDPNDKIDRRTRNIPADKRELAISLGAALLAAGRVVLQRTSRFSIGLYAPSADSKSRLRYGIKYHQTVQPDVPYFICYDDEAEDIPENRVIYGALRGNIERFAIEFTSRLDRGGLMDLKPEMLRRLDELPEEGFWNCGFSMDENEIVSFHIVPRPLPGVGGDLSPIVISLDSYLKMFDLTAVEEVTV